MDYLNKKERTSEMLKDGAFRAKSLLENYGWIYGHYYNMDDSLKGDRRHIIVYESNESGTQTIHDPVDIKTLGQFTGKVDMDGIRVYEDDILENKRGKRFIVYWNNGVGGWYNKPIQDKWHSFPSFNTGTLQSLRVIGNIHDNLDIVQAGKQIQMNV